MTEKCKIQCPLKKTILRKYTTSTTVNKLGLKVLKCILFFEKCKQINLKIKIQNYK